MRSGLLHATGRVDKGSSHKAHSGAGMQGTPPTPRPTDLQCLGVLVAVWALVIALVGLGGDYPLNDDWVYAWSVRRLVTTGRLEILDWAAPSLIGHVWWGAALMRA